LSGNRNEEFFSIWFKRVIICAEDDEAFKELHGTQPSLQSIRAWKKIKFVEFHRRFMMAKEVKYRYGRAAVPTLMPPDLKLYHHNVAQLLRFRSYLDIQHNEKHAGITNAHQGNDPKKRHIYGVTWNPRFDENGNEKPRQINDADADEDDNDENASVANTHQECLYTQAQSDFIFMMAMKSIFARCVPQSSTGHLPLRTLRFNNKVELK
jgi:hypothetical protein